LLAIVGPISLSAVLPELIVATAGCAVLIAGQAQRVRNVCAIIAVIGVVLGIAALRIPTLLNGEMELAQGSGLIFAPLADFVRIAALILGVLIVLASWSEPSVSERGEFFSMALFSLVGLMLVGASADLVVLFLALELVSIPTYVMVVLSRRSPRALEAGTKYFYLGAMSAAILAYGLALLYGVAGTASMDLAGDRIARALAAPGSLAYTLATAGLVLTIVGLFFKIAAFPLHFYIADVYEGAASPVAGLLGFVPKLAGMVAILKIIEFAGIGPTSGGLFWLLWIAAAASMTIGNVLALRQNNIKRMLAYSGIAHSGYMLVGIIGGFQVYGSAGDGAAAVLFYVVIYGIANLGAFALLGLLRNNGEPCETVRDVTGLLRRSPGAALLMALAMFTLMGMPPTPGFWGKIGLFSGAFSAVSDAADPVRSWGIGLVVIAAINTAIGAAYYLRVIAAVLLQESESAVEPAPRDAQYGAVLICGFLLLFHMFNPNLLLAAARAASDRLTRPYVATHQEPQPPPGLIAEAHPELRAPTP